ncbi:MAG: formate dehydrogenase subunit gamma [Haliea sp.]|uniref:formate dehydrogenase subunit gamma n=1 Tax=Haliea sp. TaxID=1932666 RepID=UPI0032EC703B
MPEATAGQSEVIQAAIATHRHRPGALLPILHAIQDGLGYIPGDAIAPIAQALNQSRAEVAGVLSFYHHFRTRPPGNAIVQICRAEACQAVGARQLEGHAKQRLGIDYHATTRDARISLEPVYCLGNCACGPSVRIGDAVYGRVSPAVFDALLDQLDSDVVVVQ